MPDKPQMYYSDFSSWVRNPHRGIMLFTRKGQEYSLDPSGGDKDQRLYLRDDPTFCALETELPSHAPELPNGIARVPHFGHYTYKMLLPADDRFLLLLGETGDTRPVHSYLFDREDIAENRILQETPNGIGETLKTLQRLDLLGHESCSGTANIRSVLTNQLPSEQFLLWMTYNATQRGWNTSNAYFGKDLRWGNIPPPRDIFSPSEMEF